MNFGRDLGHAAAPTKIETSTVEEINSAQARAINLSKRLERLPLTGMGVTVIITAACCFFVEAMDRDHHRGYFRSVHEKSPSFLCHSSGFCLGLGECHPGIGTTDHPVGWLTGSDARRCYCGA